MLMAHQPLGNVFVQAVKTVKPVWATLAATLSVGGNVLVWADKIKGFAAAFTVIVGAPTAVIILIYWSVKLYRLIKHPNRKE